VCFLAFLSEFVIHSFIDFTPHALGMTSFIYNHITTKWDPVQVDTVATDVYLVPNLPGDEEKYLEIPPEVGDAILSLYAQARLNME
jgi:hypothetical protein